jgi:hypothetical protein
MKTILCGVMAAILTGSTGIAMAMGSGPRHEGAAPKASAAGYKTAMAVPEISLPDLKQAIADKAVVLLDCNGSKSYANGHIPGAVDVTVMKKSGD